MLVTCPNCQAKINDTDRKCPYCGLRKAGKSSKEYNEELIKKVKRGGGYGYFSHIVSRRPCIDGSIHENHGAIISVKLEKEGIIYETIVIYKCGKCGKKIKAKVSYF